MNSTQIAAIEQVNLFNPDGTPAVQVATGHLVEYLLIPSNLVGFHNVRTDKMVESSGASVYCHLGEFPFSSSDKVCDQCGAIPTWSFGTSLMEMFIAASIFL